MSQQRTSFYQQSLETPGGQLDILCKKTMQPMSTLPGGSILDDTKAAIHERACAVKKWADGIAGLTGEYPNEAVLYFVASIRTS